MGLFTFWSTAASSWQCRIIVESVQFTVLRHAKTITTHRGGRCRGSISRFRTPEAGKKGRCARSVWVWSGSMWMPLAGVCSFADGRGGCWECSLPAHWSSLLAGKFRHGICPSAESGTVRETREHIGIDFLCPFFSGREPVNTPKICGP
jgi:hypothetical protein